MRPTLLAIIYTSVRSRLLSICVLLLSFLFLPYIVSAQDVKEEWARLYEGKAVGDLRTLHLTVDAEGNSFVTGNSYDSLFNRLQIVTAKFSPTGEELWVNHYVSPFVAEVNDITVDTLGNVYIVGSDDSYAMSRGSLLVVKYDGASGKQVWAKTQNPYQGSRGRRIMIDANGDVLTIGFTPLSFRIFFLSKFSSASGKLLWTTNITKSGIQKDLSTLLDFKDYAVDANGDVYLTGALLDNSTGGTHDIVTTKVNGNNGELIWMQSYTTDQTFATMDIALEGSEGVYVSATGTNESVLLKYNAANGEQIWLNHPVYNGAPVSEITNLMLSSGKELFSSGTIGGSGFVLKYSTDTGIVLWASAGSGAIVELNTDETGDVYAVNNPSEQAYQLVKYAASTGEILWNQTSDADPDYSYTAVDFETDESGGVVVAGLRTNVNTDFTGVLLTKHDAGTGTLLWKTTFKDSIHTNDKPTYITTDNNGNVYVSGVFSSLIGGSSRPVTVKYSPEGEELSDDFSALNEANSVFDNAGDLYKLGSRVGGDGRTELILSKIDGGDASVVWTVTKGGGYNTPQFIATDNEGGVFVTGTLVHPARPGLTTIYLQKYSAADGALLWEETFSDFFTPAELSSIVDVEVDASGDVYITGETAQSTSTQDIAVIKINGTDGSRLWKEVYNSGASDRVNDLTVDAAGIVYVLGFTDKDEETRNLFLLKYNPNNGSQLLYQQLNINGSPVVGANTLLADNHGNVYTSGFDRSSSSVFTSYIYKVNTLEPSVQQLVELTGSVTDFLIDDNGGVYVPSLLNGDVIVTKYSQQDGSKIWEITTDTDADRALFTIDKDYNIIVTGPVLNADTGYDFLTVKYSQALEEGPCYLPLQVQLSLPPHAVKVGETVLSTARFGGYIPGDAHNIRWVWGDGTEPVEAYFATGDDHITGEHIYQQPGIYRVSLDFSESCLVPENYAFEEWVVVYDPAAGFVTGGGQLNSPQTSLPWMSQPLNAQYSFTVKYNKATDTTPQGHMQLNLRKQGMFRSTSNEWLVVSGDQTIWQGTGTLNGKGNYGFTASARDAGGMGTDDAGDQLRLRIWDKSNGNQLVYDNFAQAGDILDMNTALPNIERGQVVIHPRNGALQATAAKEVKAPTQTSLSNYPNTFADQTTISFTPAETGEYSLAVYDMKGRLVKQLKTGTAQAGEQYSYELDGTTLPKGLYIARLTTPTGTQTIKMLLQR